MEDVLQGQNSLRCSRCMRSEVAVRRDVTKHKYDLRVEEAAVGETQFQCGAPDVVCGAERHS